MLVSIPSGGCVDDVAINQTNYQFTSVIVMHFMNSTGVCWIIRRTVLICALRQKHVMLYLLCLSVCLVL